MSIPEYPDLLKRFLAIVKESGYREVEPNPYVDNELEGDEFMVVNTGREYEVRFTRSMCCFHDITGHLHNVC